MTRHRVALGLRLLVILAVVALTNPMGHRYLGTLLADGRWTMFARISAIWAVALAALLLSAFQQTSWVRVMWAAIIATSTAAGVAFHGISGTDLSLFDAISLWQGRSDVARAADFYQHHLAFLVGVWLCTFVALAMRPVITRPHVSRLLSRLAWAPIVPIVLIAGLEFRLDGAGPLGMPTQFNPLSIAGLTLVRMATAPQPARQAVSWHAGPPMATHILLIVDESVRPDYLDWTPGNTRTPELAALARRIVNFGPASSGGTCSSYANAILRLGGTRRDLVRSVTTNPTIWQYARAAGYRTVFVDAHEGVRQSSDRRPAFMSVDEVRDIDQILTGAADTSVPYLDDDLVDAVTRVLRTDAPLFIYAAKSGVHFPYDRAYPATERRLRPVMSEAPDADRTARVNSYRNAIRWSVDRILGRVARDVDLARTLVIYTSDHGQNLDPRRLTHCSTVSPDPREALVPLLVMTTNRELRVRFGRGAELNQGRASHFAIPPTLLRLFGYNDALIREECGPSLMDHLGDAPMFTTGDIFGLFSRTVRWHAVDLGARYLE